jgi:hypothetical protein
MMKIVGFGLLGLFALMVLPSGEADQVNPMFYGTATMVLADPDGNAMLTQTVHNQITDEGETYIINQIMDTTTAVVAGDARVGAICIIENSDSVFGESAVSTTVNNLTDIGSHCKSTNDMSNASSLSVTDAEVFTSGTDFNAGETISGILICAKGGTGDADFQDCDSPTGTNVALAALDLTNVTVSGTDTITITYTFNIVTGSS